MERTWESVGREKSRRSRCWARIADPIAYSMESPAFCSRTHAAMRPRPEEWLRLVAEAIEGSPPAATRSDAIVKLAY